MATVSAKETDQQLAADAPSSDHHKQLVRPPSAAPQLDPQLLMAARRGDSKRLKELLQLNEEEEPAASEVVIVEVVVPPRRTPAPAASPPPPPPSRSGSSSVPAVPFLDLDDEDHGVTIGGNSLLHVVASCGDGKDFIRCAKMILLRKEKKGGASAKRLALEARNDDGDTPLHCAAGAGNAEMIKCLFDLLASTTTHELEAVAFVRLQNERGETALHHAVKWACLKRRNSANIFVGCIEKLMAVDSELASIVTHKGTSPLYLAISLGEMEITRYLLGTAKEGNLSYYSGPGGQNILHAAVSRADVDALPKVLKWLKEPKSGDDDVPQVLPQEAGQQAAHLLKQLTSQRDKENGSTPLHLAASLWGFPSTQLLPPWTWWRSGSSAIKLLLEGDANVSTAYQADKQGLYPIHVAAGGDSVLDVNTLLERCPECATLRDAIGRTFLHVAVDKGSARVVHYVCRSKNWPRWQLSVPAAAAGVPSILNAQDKNGDTPLHRAVHAGDFLIFSSLFWNPEVRWDVQNDEGKRPIDVSWSTMPLKAYHAWDPRMHIRTLLLKMVVPYGKSRGDLFYDELVTINLGFKGGEGKVSENLTAAAQVMGIFSVLITTVTFASAFTLPGGYRSAGDGGVAAAGTPVLSGSYAFDAFILADALAFICSFLATSLLLYAGLPAYNLDIRFRYINAAYGLMMNSGRSLLAALGLGLYVVLIPVAHTIPLAVAALVTMLTIYFVKGSEAIDYMLDYPLLPRRSREFSLPDKAEGLVVFMLEHFWSYMLIFGIPAFRKWARAR